MLRWCQHNEWTQKGVEKVISDEQPNAVYTHCYIVMAMHLIYLLENHKAL